MTERVSDERLAEVAERWAGMPMDTEQGTAAAIAAELLLARAEIAALVHDIERYIDISSEHATESDRLREAIAAMRSQVHNLPRCVTADRIDAIAGAALGDGATP